MKRVVVFASLALLASLEPLYGQAVQGAILGTVTDASGGAVPGAKVLIRNEGTNFERTIETDPQGDYRVSGLESGNYQVTVTAPGFTSFKQTRVDLSLNQIKRVDASMQVGDISTTVTVEGGTSQVETEAVQLSNLKTNRDYTQLPLSVFGRPDMLAVTQVVAGLQSTSGFEAHGARNSALQVSSDGISVNTFNSGTNGPNGFVGDLDNLKEVKVIVSNSGAEYPQVAQFASVSRTGENTVHGSVYWGNFNTLTSARRWQDGASPGGQVRNFFAGTVGGPVWIPKLYDGHNKTFFFFSYGGIRSSSANRLLLSVPTTQFKDGDFSALAGRINLVDPLNGQPFANNRVPGNRISAVSRAFQDLVYPDPNQAGVGTYGLTANYAANPGSTFDADNYSVRVDHRLSSRNTIFARVALTINNKDYAPGGLKSGYGTDNWKGNHPSRLIVISDTHAFAPNLVNELKLGFYRDLGYNTDINFGQSIITQIGLQGISNPQNDPTIGGMPAFTFSGANGFEGTSTFSNGGYTAQNTYQFIDNLSWFRGRHSFKFGFDVRKHQSNTRVSPQSKRGQFSFDDRLSGFSYANFLLGYPSSSRRTIARPSAHGRGEYYGFYLQDDFKLHPNITFNYGVRYEYQTPWVDLYDRMFTFQPTTGALITAGTAIPKDLVPAVAAALPIVSASQAGVPTRSLIFSDKNNWSPRVGLAIRPFGGANTVVRLGYGLYTQLNAGQLATRGTGGPWESNEDFPLESNRPAATFPNPFVTTSQFSGLQSVTATNSYFPNERTQQWNASVGRQVLGMAIDVAYVGTKTMNLPYVEDLNLLRPSTTPYSPARRPYPLFTSVSFAQTGGSSIYHGLAIQADRRMAAGLFFNVNYTLAKVLTDVDLRNYFQSSEQNQYNRSLERSDDRNIRRQQLRFSYIYELPVGRGKKFLGGLSSLPNYVLGGWQVAGITTMLTGARLSPSFSGVDAANTNQNSGRPDRLGNGNFDADLMRDKIKARTPIFDRSAFERPAAGRGFYGNSARYILTGPGEVTWNITAAKNIMIRERARLQLRYEMFNALNHPNFNNPSTNITAGNFGLVTGSGNARSMLLGARIDF